MSEVIAIIVASLFALYGAWKAGQALCNYVNGYDPNEAYDKLWDEYSEKHKDWRDNLVKLRDAEQKLDAARDEIEILQNEVADRDEQIERLKKQLSLAEVAKMDEARHRQSDNECLSKRIDELKGHLAQASRRLEKLVEDNTIEIRK